MYRKVDLFDPTPFEPERCCSSGGELELVRVVYYIHARLGLAYRILGAHATSRYSRGKKTSDCHLDGGVGEGLAMC